MLIYCKYYDKCKQYESPSRGNKQCKTCKQRIKDKMNESQLQEEINNECKTIVLPDSSDWLERCKRCSYYDFEFYERSHRALDGKHKLRQHTIIKCTNPKGTRFDNANCFKESKDDLRNIRKSRMPRVTANKMKNTKEVNENMKVKVKKAIIVPEGLHTGKIVNIDYRDDPYDYTDVIIHLDDIDVYLKYGCPTHISEVSKLGRLLALFTKLTVDKEVDIDQVLIGKKLQFQTTNKKSNKGTFAEILSETVKAIEK